MFSGADAFYDLTELACTLFPTDVLVSRLVQEKT